MSVPWELDPPAGADRPVAVELIRSVTPGDATTIAIAVEPRCTSSDACPGLPLPDLVPQLDLPPLPPGTPQIALDERSHEFPSPREWRIDRESKPGRALLRVSTLTANLGDGPLVLVRGDVAADLSEATVYQRLIDANGRYLDIEAGRFEHHEPHGHVHLEAFEEMRLVDSSGNVVARSAKLSFCLTDVFPVDSAARLSVDSTRIALPPWQCDAFVQAINPGFVDFYGRELPDQYLDITGVPAGDYLLEFVADPDDVLVESDETNNVASFAIALP